MTTSRNEQSLRHRLNGLPDVSRSCFDDDSSMLAVAVTSQDGADAVRAAGAIPELVRYRAEQLEATKAELDARSVAPLPARRRGVDPRANRVVVVSVMWGEQRRGRGPGVARRGTDGGDPWYTRERPQPVTRPRG
jgi:hypothetical protein